MTATTASHFRRYTQDLRAEVDGALAGYVDFGSDCPDVLRAAIRHSLLAPGKRLRPLLVLMACEACGRDRRKALPAACAVEMVHTYSLIHDDLPAMDDDDLRRGLPTCHRQFGEANAILAGDALLARAFQVLAEEVQPADVAARCCAELAVAAGAEALVGGQVDDLAADQGEQTLDRLEAIHRRKTGAMFLASLRLGGLVAGAASTELEALTRYGRQLGLAFQIVDDLLDLGGTTAALGKRAGKDHEQGKLTFPALLGESASRQRAADLIESACQALVSLGDRGDALSALARYVLERDR